LGYQGGTVLKLLKEDLCSSCREIHPLMADGKPYETSLSGFLESKGYVNGATSYVMINLMIREHLENSGGCTNCINLLRKVTYRA